MLSFRFRSNKHSYFGDTFWLKVHFSPGLLQLILQVAGVKRAKGSITDYSFSALIKLRNLASVIARAASEVDLGLLQHPRWSALYHKALHLGCCSSPRSASVPSQYQFKFFVKSEYHLINTWFVICHYNFFYFPPSDFSVNNYLARLEYFELVSRSTYRILSSTFLIYIIEV